MTSGALTIEQLDALATGRPGPDELTILQVAQDAKRRLLLLALRRSLRGPILSDVESAFDLLDQADAVDPAAVNEILGRPLIDAWLARCIWGLKHRGLDAPEVAADIRYLGAVAAASAARAGLDFETQLPATGGDVFLPGVGGAVGLGEDRTVVRSGSVGIEIVGAAMKVVQGGDGWRVPHRVTVAASQPWRLEVEDQDPHRDCFGYRPADYLSPAALAELTELMAAAWQLIETDHPGYAAVMRASLRSVVPLAAPPNAGAEGVALSASSQLAYGSVAVLVPADAPTLANLLIHEVQHMTLSGVLDIVELYTRGGRARHHAPWRLDPRPVGPLLQGTFAHLGVTDFWRARRHRESGPAREKAEFEFAYWRELTTRAIQVLAGSGELTASGDRFVAGMASTMDSWWAESVPPVVGAAARDAADADTILWRARNQEPSDDVRTLGQAYRDGQPCPKVGAPAIAERPATPARRRGLAAGIRDTLLPAESAQPSGSYQPSESGQPSEAADTGDRAYLAGDFERAAETFSNRIGDDPGDDDAWVGLAMTLHRVRAEPAATVLARRPELVRALYEATRPTGGSVEELADWLSTGVIGDQGEGGSV